MTGCSVQLPLAANVSPIPAPSRTFDWVGLNDAVMPAWEGGASADNLFTYIFPNDNIWESPPSIAATPARRRWVPT
jgi:hypothetical protein